MNAKPQRVKSEEPKTPVRPADDMGTDQPAAATASPDMPEKQSQTVSEDEVPAERPRGRRERKPFGSRRQRLRAEAREGYHRHWFNDSPGRIKEAVEAGYEHVKEDGKPIHQVVGRDESGKPMDGYLMEIPIQWYLEDMKEREREADEIDEAIRGGEVGRKKGDQRYVPGGAIRIGSNT